MNKMIRLGFICVLMSIQTSVVANEEFIAEQRSDFDTLSSEDIKKMRQDILNMSDVTLKRLYKEHPKAKNEIQNAYGYGVFQGQAVNLVLYVAGNGLGVVYDNKTNTPIFMNAIRAGTGPGVGYKSLHGVLIFSNKKVFDQFTTIGLQVSASGDAVMKVAGEGTGASESVSLVPGVSSYQLIDKGLVLQANWGQQSLLKIII